MANYEIAHTDADVDGLAGGGRAHATPTREQRHWQVIAMLAARAPLDEITAATGYRPRTIRQIAQRYREAGPPALADGRQRSRGAPPLLPADVQHELCCALQCPPADGGVWTGPKVARWIAARLGRPVHRQRGWEYLRRLEAQIAALAAPPAEP